MRLTLPIKPDKRVLVGGILTVLVLFLAYPVLADELVSVTVSSRDNVERLFALGVDVWEVADGRALVHTEAKDLQRLVASGFEASVLCSSREGIYRFLGVNTARMLSADAGHFHTYAEMTADLQQVASDHPDICGLFSIGQSVEGRELWMMKISDNPALDEEEPEVVFIANQHAREWISEEVALGLIHYFTDNYSSPTVSQVVDATEIFVLPLANPDGKEYTHTTDRMWRKNRRNNGDGTFGIDLNRNFPFKFRYGVSTSDAQYGGPYPLSEPEIQHFADFATSHSIVAVMNYHSYGQQILYPWAYSYNAPYDQQFLSGFAQRIRDAINGAGLETYIAGQWSGDLGYLGYGETGDWFYAERGAACLGIELRPAGAPYFLIDESEIAPTTQENIPGALELIQWAHEQRADVTLPVLQAGMVVEKQAANRLLVRWETDDYANGYVEFGPTLAFGSYSLPNPIRGEKHRATVCGLMPGTQCYARCVSENLSGLTVHSDLLPDCITSLSDGIIIDNLDPQFSTIGWWNHSTNVSGYFGDDYAWAESSWSTAAAQWAPEIPLPGSYRVHVRYTSASERAADAPYTVYYEGGEQTICVNQNVFGGTWFLLGTFPCGSDGFRIVLTNGASMGTVIADAVKLEYIRPPHSVKYWTLY